MLELWIPPGERPGTIDSRLMEAIVEAIGKAFAEAGLHYVANAEDSSSSVGHTLDEVSKTCNSLAEAAEVLLKRLRASIEFDVGAFAERGDGPEEFVVIQSCLFLETGTRGSPSHPAENDGSPADAMPSAPGDIPQRAAAEPGAEAWVNQVLRHARPFSGTRGAKRVSLPHQGWQSWVVVPLWGAGLVRAIVALGKTGSEAFSQAEVDFLDDVCDEIAVLWENLSLRTKPSSGGEHEAMAERLATLEQLAAGAAHEIKNPLAVVRGYLQVMQSDASVSDAVKNRIGRLLRQLDQIGNIVEDFLQLVRPVTAEFAPLSLTGMLEEVLEIVEPQALESGIRIVRDYYEDTPEVMADGGKLGQVFLNLCRNSLEAMAPMGGGELRVTTRASSDKHCVEVEFRDTGPGMSPDVMSHIFRPFFTTKKHGTGLGLNISMDIVKRHGGTIHAESTPGAGSAFTVVLPVAPE